MKILNSHTAAMLLLAFAAGCDSQPRPASEAPAAAPAPPAATSSQGASPAPVTPQPAASAPPSLASAEGEQPGLRIEVQELKRTEGGTLTLRLAFVNTGGRTQFNVGNLDEINLIDVVGKKKYFVVRDTQDVCLCSRDISSLDADARANVWAKFPAPPEDVQKITVVVPQFQPLEGIPIS